MLLLFAQAFIVPDNTSLYDSNAEFDLESIQFIQLSLNRKGVFVHFLVYTNALCTLTFDMCRSLLEIEI